MKPLLINNLNIAGQQTTHALSHISLDTPPYNESWLQDLIHNHPSLVPAGDVEACFEKIVPVVREFTLPSGSLDNLYVTPDGYPVLVEVKLWKNQEARRKVVAQILEYAKDFTGLSYERINKEIRQKTKPASWGDNPLYELVCAAVPNPDDEQTFVNRVTRNLKEGRFLLLILGDGIREDMAALAEYLMHHSLRYAFGIVEVKLFKLPDGNVIACPTVLAKTQTIERHVTVVTSTNNSIQLSSDMPIISEQVEKTSLSLDGFYSVLEARDPKNAKFVRELIQSLADLPIEPEVGKNGDSLMLKTTIPNVGRIQFMYFTLETVQLWGIPAKHWKNPDWQQLATTYLEQFARLDPQASVKISDTNASADVKIDGKQPLPIRSLQGKVVEVADAIRQVTQDATRFFAANGGSD